MTPIFRRARHPPWVYAQRILRNVWNDPAVRGERGRAIARTIGWNAYKRLIRRPVTRELVEGVRIRCYPDSSISSKVVYLGGFPDRRELEFLRHYLRPGDRVLDCGANIGTYALLLGRLVGPNGRVLAFEPFAPIRARLEENIALNRFQDRVQVFPEALSNKPGVLEFITDQDTANRFASGNDPADARRTEVPVTTLDQRIAEQLAFAKVDVEGAEMHVLQGAETLLRTAPPVVWQFEVVDHLLEKQGCTSAQLYDFLEGHGYVFAVFDSENHRLKRCSPHGHHDILAVLGARWDEVLRRLESKSSARC